MVSVLVPVFCYRKVSLELVVNDFTSLSVEVFQNVTVLFVEYAMNSPCFGMEMHESVVLGTGHSETVDPVDASNFLIVWSDTTKRWLLDQTRPLL